MTETAVVFTDSTDSVAAGAALGEQIARAIPGAPDVVVVFAAGAHQHARLLAALQAACRPRLLVGASSAGEFAGSRAGTGSACALAIRSAEMRFSLGVGRGLTADRAAAARELVSGFQGASEHAFPYRSALILTDALAGHADDLIDRLMLLTSGMYQFFGGGAGDDGQFRRTHVFAGTEAMTDAAVALEILSAKPLGVGVGHGWQPASTPFRVTEAAGMRLISLNGLPAVEVFEAHAAATGQRLDRANALPFFLHNILGIETAAGHRLRVPLAVNADGSVSCAADVPVGAIVRVMTTSAASAAEAASTAVRRAVAGLEGAKPQVALFFDCVATRLRLGDGFSSELESVLGALGPTGMVGCNTYGQIARAEGQFGGFHNCTAVVCVLPA